MRNGIIGLLGPGTDHKVVDVKITNTFPLLTLRPHAVLVHRGTAHDISGFQHVSMPGDMRIHLTRRVGLESEHRFLSDPVDPATLHSQPLRVLTFVSPPVSLQTPLSGRWDQGVIISPLADALYDPDRSRLFVDFLVQSSQSAAPIEEVPYALDGMRPAPDRSGDRLGPFALDILFRRGGTEDRLLLSMRWGFFETTPQDDCIVIPAA